jgi:hypothetical protein
MHPDPQLVDLFRGVRQDARNDPKPTEVAQAFPINIGFDGGGLLPTVGSVMMLPLGNLKAKVMGAVIVANGIGSATIDLRLGSVASVPTLAPIYSSAATIPTLTSAASATLDTSLWTRNILPGDVLIATLTAVSSAVASPGTGALTCVCLALYCTRMKWVSGAQTVTDGTGGLTVTDSNGNTVTLRS